MINALLLAWPIDDMLVNLALVLLALVSLSTVLTSINTFRVEIAAGIVTKKRIIRFAGVGILAFLALAVALISKNIVSTWIALEIVTVLLAVVVRLYAHPSGDASGAHYVKRIAIGVVLGIVGVVILVKAALSSGIFFYDALRYEALGAAASTLPEPMIKIAFVLLFISLATKIGIVPFHTWIPEMYSKISSPFSGFLAAMFPFTSFLVLLRLKDIADRVMDDRGEWSSRFFLAFGVLSVLVTAVMLYRQKNYKRTVAIAGLHHSGITIFLTGLGPAGLIPAIVHAVAQALLTAGAFGASGVVHGTYKTSKFSGVRESLRLIPQTSGLGILLLLATIALPFSPFFMSEIVGFGYGLQEHVLLTLLVAGGVVTGSVFLCGHALRILTATDTPLIVNGPVPSWRLANGVLALFVIFVFGLGMISSTETGIRNIIRLVEGVGGL